MDAQVKALSQRIVDALVKDGHVGCGLIAHGAAFSALVASLVGSGVDGPKEWYDEAMKATNEAGYVGMDAASVIRDLPVDASRYDFLRAAVAIPSVFQFITDAGPDPATPEEMDARIDTARANYATHRGAA